MLPAEFEPVIPASERKQNYALDGATASVGLSYTVGPKQKSQVWIRKTNLCHFLYTLFLL